MPSVAVTAANSEELSGEELTSLLSAHGQFGCYVKADDEDGQIGVILDGWFDLDAVAAAINQKTRSSRRQAQPQAAAELTPNNPAEFAEATFVRL